MEHRSVGGESDGDGNDGDDEDDEHKKRVGGKARQREPALLAVPPPKGAVGRMPSAGSMRRCNPEVEQFLMA